MADQQPIVIDGKHYEITDLSDAAQAHIQSLQFVEAEIARLNAQIAVINTAKIAYQNALKELLPE